MDTELLVPSFTHENTVYTVTRRNEQWSCSCPARVPCKHIPIAETVSHALERCATQHGGSGHEICALCLTALTAAMSKRVKSNYIPKAEARARASSKVVQMRRR